MRDGRADHKTPPRCAMQLRPMLRLEGVKGNGKSLGRNPASSRVARCGEKRKKPHFLHPIRTQAELYCVAEITAPGSCAEDKDEKAKLLRGSL